MIDLIYAANDLSESIKRLKALKQFFDSNLSPVMPTEENRRNLSIRFSYSVEYKEITVRLGAIEDIYEELARLSGISTTDIPLGLSKLESGSLWTVVSGESGVVKVLAGVIKSIARHIYEAFSEKGHVEWSSRVISNQIDLRYKLEAAGIDTTEVDEELNRAAVRLAKRTTALLQGEPAIEIDGEQLSVGWEKKERFIQESKKQLITWRDVE